METQIVCERCRFTWVNADVDLLEQNGDLHVLHVKEPDGTPDSMVWCRVCWEVEEEQSHAAEERTMDRKPTPEEMVLIEMGLLTEAEWERVTERKNR